MVRRVSDGLWLLMTAVATVLLIICVNLANLLLARNARRRQEFALRAALGAGRGRLLRQLLIESLLLSTVGGALGIAGAYLALGAVLRTAPVDLPRAQEIAVSPGVLAFALGLSWLVGLAFGLLPALRLYAAAPADTLRSGGRTTADPSSGRRTRQSLIAGQVALCTMLVVTCGLLLGSFTKIMAVDRGFDATRIASADLLLSPSRYATFEQRSAFFRSLLQQLEGLPGVRSAGMVQTMPLRGLSQMNMVSRSTDVRPAFERPVANFVATSPRYFETLGIRCGMDACSRPATSHGRWRSCRRRRRDGCGPASIRSDRRSTVAGRRSLRRLRRPARHSRHLRRHLAPRRPADRRDGPEDGARRAGVGRASTGARPGTAAGAGGTGVRRRRRDRRGTRAALDAVRRLAVRSGDSVRRDGGADGVRRRGLLPAGAAATRIDPLTALRSE
jgi:hypothetical protein